MTVILKRTLQETLKLPFIIICILAGYIAGSMMDMALNHGYTLPSYTYMRNLCIIEQDMLVFFLIAGAIAIALVSAVASGLVAAEVHEGTFRLLVAKPHSRTHILLGKVLGMLIGCSILVVLALSTMYLTEALNANFDGSVYMELLSRAPGYLVYAAIVILYFSSVAVLLSNIFKKRLFAFLPMIILMVMTLAVPVVVRLITNVLGKDAGLFNFFDMNYHFSSIFRDVMQFMCGPLSATSSQMELYSVLTNAFYSVSTDVDLLPNRSGIDMYVANELFSGRLLLIVYCALTAINYFLSFMIIRKKDV